MDFHTSQNEVLIICGQYWWDEKECNTCSGGDPNGDDWNDCGSDEMCNQVDFDGSENNSIWDENEGIENNNRYDQIDLNGDGIISLGEAEPAKEDFDRDGIYTPHPSYDYTNQYYYWNDFYFLFLLKIY